MSSPRRQKTATQRALPNEVQPCLENERRPDAELIVIKAEIRERTVVFAMKIINACCPEISQGDINGWLDEKVIIAPRRIHEFDRAKVI